MLWTITYPYLQELAELQKSEVQILRDIIVDESNILVWKGKIYPVGDGYRNFWDDQCVYHIADASTRTSTLPKTR